MGLDILVQNEPDKKLPEDYDTGSQRNSEYQFKDSILGSIIGPLIAFSLTCYLLLSRGRQ